MAYREQPLEMHHIEIAVATLPAPTVVGSGVAAGIIAGIVMAVWAMTTSAITGAGFWIVPQLIAGMFYGPLTLVRGATTVVIGTLIHVVVSAGFGALFALMVGWRAGADGRMLAWGLAYGLAIWLVMSFGVLPLVNPTMSARVALTPVNWFFEHLLFGVVLAFFFEQMRATRLRRPAFP